MNRNIYLFKNDWKFIGRDPILILCLIAPILLLLVALLLLPIVSGITTRMFNFPIDSYFAIIRLFLFSLTPMMLGMIYGFILLDERDGGIISYLAITPIGKSGYLTVRMLVPVALSFVSGFIFLIATGFSSLLNGIEMIALSAIVATEAPLMLLFLGAFASNKVEGIAISKGFGIIMLPMLIDYFLKGGWRWALSVSPLWWVERAVFGDLQYRWPYLLGAATVHCMFIFMLFKKFEKQFR